MILHDMMSGFELYQPDSVDGALELLDRFGSDGWALAGGYDSLDWFKNRGKRPRAVIDLEGLEALRGVRETADGVEIGALTTLTEVTRHPLIVGEYGLLANAAGHVASPQIRNAGTIGGNLCQDARCWYYRSGLACYRAGGNVCYADTPEGMNREHALFGADRCVAVTPSDTAPALVALDAEMVVQRAGSERIIIPAADFFMGPGVDITRMTVLEPEELLVSIRLPARWAGARFHFEKVAERKSWDFPLVNLAAAILPAGGGGGSRSADGSGSGGSGAVDDIRLVAGAVQCVPRRLTGAEDVVRREGRSEDAAARAGAAAVVGARPLNHNHFKIPVLEKLVRRAVLEA